MLQLINTTGFQATILVCPNPDGIDSVYTVVKATYEIGSKVRPEERGVAAAETQVPICLKDEFSGEPGKSSIAIPCDIALFKPGTDVLLRGTAHSPGGRAATAMAVSMRVGRIGKSVLVTGDRRWKKSITGMKATDPEPFRTIPLEWERAYGGSDVIQGAALELQEDARNPVGVGFHARGGRNELDGMSLPNLEDPRNRIDSTKDSPPPAGFGPICPHWEPRRSYAGTYDEAWQKERVPLLPKDFDPRFFQLAPPDLIHVPYLSGGEAVEIVGATPSGALRFNLPKERVRTTYFMDGVENAMDANLDTVLVEPDLSRLILVWRSGLVSGKKTSRVSAVEVKNHAGARA